MIAAFLLMGSQAARLTVPPAAYSYPELAQLLSTPELSVSVDGTLRDRGALVGLSHRSQEEAIRVVCRGLDLATEPVGPGKVRLVPDPAVEKRDQRFRRALLDDISGRWHFDVQTLSRLLDLTPVQLEIEERRVATLAPSRREAVLQGIRKAQNRSATLRAALGWAASAPSSIGLELFTEDYVRSEVRAALPNRVVEALKSEQSYPGAQELVDPVMLQRIFVRERSAIRVNSAFFAKQTDGRWRYVGSPSEFLRIGRPGSLFSDLLASDPSVGAQGLGEEARTWFEASKRSTDSILSRSEFAEPVDVPGYENALSAAVRNWAEKRQRDVVMELAPIGETLLQNSNRLDRLHSYPFVLRQLFADDGWGLEETEGALVVRNRLAFVDRMWGSPNGAIAHFARTRGDRTGVPDQPDLDRVRSGPGFPRYEDLLPLVRLRFAPNRSKRTWFNSGAYLGLSESVVRGRSIFLWPGIPSELTRRIRSQKDGKAEIPLTSFPPNVLRNYFDTLLVGDPVDRDRRLAEAFEGAKVSVCWWRRPDGETSIAINVLGGADLLLGDDLAAFTTRV